MSEAFFLFAPKFKEFGAHVGGELVRRGVITKVSGMATGGGRVVHDVMQTLGTACGEIRDVDSLEKQWISQDAVDWQALRALENELGPSAMGELLTSDRRVGSGFVVGGLLRPD